MDDCDYKMSEEEYTRIGDGIKFARELYEKNGFNVYQYLIVWRKYSLLIFGEKALLDAENVFDMCYY